MSCAAKGVGPETVVDYCAGTLDRHAAREFEQHAAGCPDCEHALARQQQLWTLLDSWDDVPLSADFNRRLYQAIEREEGVSPVRRYARLAAARLWPLSWRPLVPLGAIAATLAIALIIETPGPRLSAPPPDAQVKSEKLDVDQVESALDDIDLLQKLSDASPSAM